MKQISSNKITALLHYWIIALHKITALLHYCIKKKDRPLQINETAGGKKQINCLICNYYSFTELITFI